MQIPAQGRFSESPGWALRPAFGQNDWRTNTAWRQPGTASRARRYLQGLGGMLPNISVQYTYNPQIDYNLQVQALMDWYNKYYQQAYSISEQVMAELRRRGFQVQVIQTPEQLCNPSANCYDYVGHLVNLTKNGFTMQAGMGDRGSFSRVNSVSEFADSVERAFLASYESQTGAQYQQQPQPTVTQPQATVTQPQPTVTQPQPTVTQPQPTVTQPTVTQTQPTVTQQTYATGQQTMTYAKSAVLLAPDGYRTGGRFTLKIQGKPNSQVSIRAWQNGSDHGTTPFGTTDSQGYYEISGVWQDVHAGQWREIVYVGGETVGELNFTVVKPEPPPANTVGTSTPSITTTAQEPVLTQDEIPSSATQPSVVTSPSDVQITSQSTFQFSGLALLAAVGVALLLISGNGKK